jgi:putative mRNA 3-end processing factor
LEKGVCVIDGKVRKVKAQVEHFDFSSHCGAGQLREVIRNLEDNPKVFAVHGAEGNCGQFARWVKKETDLKAKAPKAGDRFII